ncbi:kinase-like protein [Amniculicola lignicola CBS 123094]|uniref:non-specific serine/threonine protein kinase n=1 Tax=Amniculicola lignicola CBS 123094 TaxID=1392246 RepID=A0A6A5X5G8_9PLEO|nr:kinase-like protein [Amniculicola lignicola CBS 123094]
MDHFPTPTLTINEGDDLDLDITDKLPFVLVKNLGHGASAIVEMVQDTNNGRLYARKVFRNLHARRAGEAKQTFQNELRAMRRLKPHPHIIQVFATYITQRELALLLTPVADAGDLAAFLQLYRDMDSLDRERESRKAILWRAYGCLASGLAFIHQQTIRHKDIKPQNILIHQGRVIFTDFGISFDFSERDRSTTTGNPNAFTRRYCSPEVANWDNRNSKSDVFSLGCVFVEILDALQPTLLPSEFLQGPFHRTIDQLPFAKPPLSNQWGQAYYYMLELIRDMLLFNPETRISAVEVVSNLSVHLGDLELFCTLCNPNQKVDPVLVDVERYREENMDLDNMASEMSPFTYTNKLSTAAEISVSQNTENDTSAPGSQPSSHAQSYSIISKLPDTRYIPIYCPHCNTKPEGYRGPHELERHLVDECKAKPVLDAVDGTTDGKIKIIVSFALHTDC